MDKVGFSQTNTVSLTDERIVFHWNKFWEYTHFLVKCDLREIHLLNI